MLCDELAKVKFRSTAFFCDVLERGLYLYQVTVRGH